MKVTRRKFNIFELMEIEVQKSNDKGPVEEFLLTPQEFKEFTLNAKNRPHTSFNKVVGRPDDPIGGDWFYKGAKVTLNGKLVD